MYTIKPKACTKERVIAIKPAREIENRIINNN